jgi:hypothetical protein
MKIDLERLPYTWNHVIEKESLKFKELEHVLIEKVEQLFWDMRSVADVGRAHQGGNGGVADGHAVQAAAAAGEPKPAGRAPRSNSRSSKPVFPALGAPMSPAWGHGSPHVEDLALPKSVERGNLSVNKVVIRWMSV